MVETSYQLVADWYQPIFIKNPGSAPEYLIDTLDILSKMLTHHLYIVER